MESSFQYTNPVLVSLDFNINPEYNNVDGEEVKIPMQLSVNVSRETEKQEAVVSLICEIGEERTDIPFFVKAEEQARFKWGDDIKENMVDRLLSQNAPSLLLSFLRPIVAQVTLSSPYGAYYLPFINFTKSIDENKH